MGIDIQKWNDSCQKIEKQVEEFNKQIQTNLTDEKVDEIYKTIEKEINRLQKYSDKAADREKKLKKNTFFNCNPSNRKIYPTIVACITAQVITGVGGSLNYISDSLAYTVTGIILLSMGIIVGSSTAICETCISAQSKELLELSNLNEEGLENAKIFRKFIKKLKKVKDFEKQILEIKSNATSLSSISQETGGKKEEKIEQVIDILPEPGQNPLLDDRIKKCINSYEELPKKYQEEGLYSRIISVLIQHLPDTDPIKIDLKKLDETAENDISLQATKPLKTQYLQVSDLTDEEENKWNNEQANQREHIHPFYQNEQVKSDSKQEMKKHFTELKKSLYQRFKVRNLNYIDTTKGWRIQPGKNPQNISKNPILETIS